MTQTAQVIGTAQYLSPEQARGERVDARSDLYSTGCLLYELLTGRPPFTGDSPVAIAYQHVRENPIPPSRVDPEIPQWADSIVLKAMAKDPGDRYQSAGDMRNDIQRALQGMPVAAPTQFGAYQGTRRMGAATQMAGATGAIPPYDYGPEDDQPGGRKKWPWIVAAVAAVAVIAGLIWGFNYISSSGGNIAVPNVVGQTQAQAQKAIVAAGLVPSVVDKASSSVHKGDVISTSPPFGTKLSKNATVKLFVSEGPASVKVPRVVGENENAATSQLENEGFVVSQKPQPNSAAPQGQVVSQNPKAGTSVAKGSGITIYVSGGGAQVPSVIGDPVATAQQILSGAGFNVVTKTVQGPAGSTPGNVFQQTPSGGTAPTGSNVTIFVAAQQTSSPSPSPSPSASSSPSPSPSASNNPGFRIPSGGAGRAKITH
jgi:serine/threonine-protein kinase